jgi:hypothetical protein
VVNAKVEGVSANSHAMKKEGYSYQGRKIFSSEKSYSTIRPELLPKAEDQAPGLIKALHGTSFFCLLHGK